MPVTRHSFQLGVVMVVVLAGLAALSQSASAAGGPSGRHRVVHRVPPGAVARPAFAGASAAAAAAGRRRHPIRVGSVLVPPCPASPLAWCTTIKVPYDYFDPAAGTIRLGFQWYPASGGGSSRTIVAIQGGTGYATTDYASAYVALFGPLLAHRNLLLVDLRGT